MQTSPLLLSFCAVFHTVWNAVLAWGLSPRATSVDLAPCSGAILALYFGAHYWCEVSLGTSDQQSDQHSAGKAKHGPLVTYLHVCTTCKCKCACVLHLVQGASACLHVLSACLDSCMFVHVWHAYGEFRCLVNDN